MPLLQEVNRQCCVQLSLLFEGCLQLIPRQHTLVAYSRKSEQGRGKKMLSRLPPAVEESEHPFVQISDVHIIFSKMSTRVQLIG